MYIYSQDETMIVPSDKFIFTAQNGKIFAEDLDGQHFRTLAKYDTQDRAEAVLETMLNALGAKIPTFRLRVCK